MGLAGSLHCAGMCSPLAMAITNSNRVALRNRIIYNLGRITTYGLLGAVVGTIGYLLPWNGFQNIFSVVFGVVLIVMAAIGITGFQIPVVTPGVLKFTALLKQSFTKFLQHKSSATLLLMGGLNGLLPCGLTFLALSFCLAVATPFEGFIHMLAFGAGTLPVMLCLVSVVGFIANKMQWNIKTVTTGLMVISGMLLIARIFIVHLPESHQHTNLMDIVICR